MHSDYLEIRNLVRVAKTKRNFKRFSNGSVICVMYTNKIDTSITITREQILKGYIGEYDFYAHMAKTYAKEGKMYLFRKYAILGNEIAKIANALGANLHVFEMDTDFKKKLKGYDYA